MLKKIGIAAAVVIVALIAVVAMQPGTYHVERSSTVNAPTPIVYAEIADLNRMAAWSPWEKLDPNMKKQISGTPGSVGHANAWEGNDQVGKGSMTFTEVVPNDHVTSKLVFLEPWTGTAMTTLAIKAVGDKTAVTWSMEGDQDFMGKAFGMFMDMDAMIGADYEKGLASLGIIAEAKHKELQAAAAAAAQAQAAEQAQAAAAAAEVAPASPTTKK